MNRTLRVERLPVTGVAEDEILVATEITHPERGYTGCPAAPLVMAALEHRLHDEGAGRYRLRSAPVATVPVPGPVPAPAQVAAAPGPFDAIVTMASYLDRTGRSIGFGVATPADDRVASAACADLVAEWAGVLRSRRLLLADADPDCAGARAAIDTTLEAAMDTPVYLFGQPVASACQLTRIAKAGVTIVTDLDAVPDSATVVFPAHGVPLPVRAEAAARGLRVVDATCPLVASAHRDIRSYADRGDTVALITTSRGVAAEHASVSQAPESVLPVRDGDDVGQVRSDPDRLSVVVQTGVPVDEAVRMVSALRARFPRLRGQHYDALCYAATDRADTVRQVAGASDLTLVLGSAADPDAAHMAAEAAAVCSTVRRVGAVGDIAAGWLADAGTIGLVPTRSGDTRLLAQVRDALSGLGPLSVATRQTRTSHGPDGTAGYGSAEPVSVAPPRSAGDHAQRCIEQQRACTTLRQA